jgi:hypothetical protein
MPTFYTGFRVHGQLLIMVGSHFVSCKGEVVIFVDKPDIEP